MELWEHGAVGTWNCGNIELWEQTATQSCGNMELKSYGDVFMFPLLYVPTAQYSHGTNCGNIELWELRDVGTYKLWGHVYVATNLFPPALYSHNIPTAMFPQLYVYYYYVIFY